MGETSSSPSQPSAMFPLQSSKPGWHTPMMHVVFAQAGKAFGGGGHG